MTRSERREALLAAPKVGHDRLWAGVLANLDQVGLRVAAMHAMRAAYDAAVAAGANVPTPSKDDVKAMSLGDIRMWTETYRAEAERVAVQPAEAEADERGPEPEF
jgi:hypothetical protein